MPPLLIGADSSLDHHKGDAVHLWWFRLSRSVTSWPLKVGLVLQVEIFGRGSAVNLDL